MTTDEPREEAPPLPDATLGGARAAATLAWAALVLGLRALARLHVLDAWWR